MIETSLKENTKIVVPAGADLVNVLGEMAGILPVKTHKPEPPINIDQSIHGQG